jgi:hypothetical protein
VLLRGRSAHPSFDIGELTFIDSTGIALLMTAAERTVGRFRGFHYGSFDRKVSEGVRKAFAPAFRCGARAPSSTGIAPVRS